jgi:hypothetical protein
LNEVIASTFKTYNFNSGQNFLAFELVRKMISTFFRKQLKEDDQTLNGKYITGSELKKRKTYW